MDASEARIRDLLPVIRDTERTLKSLNVELPLPVTCLIVGCPASTTQAMLGTWSSGG